MKIRKIIFPALCIALIAIIAGAFLTAPAHASGTTYSVSCTNNVFTVTRSGDVSQAETVRYRTVSESAVAGVHFVERTGTVSFAAGSTSANGTVTVTEKSPTATSSSNRVPEIDRYAIGNVDHTYRFELLAYDKDTVLASCRRSINYGSSYNLSGTNTYAAYYQKEYTLQSSETEITDAGYKTNTRLTIPLSSYASATAPLNYFKASGAEVRMSVELDAREEEDGYQYIQIRFNGTTPDADNDADGGDPGEMVNSTYMAGFEHGSGGKNTTYAHYSFPLASGTTWSGNSIGVLCTQKFASGANASGQLVIPSGASSGYIFFDASGKNNDDWYIQNVKTYIRAYDSAAPYITGVYASPGTYGYGDTITVAVRFSEVVKVTNSRNVDLYTNFGMLHYDGGSGTTVLYFTGTLSGYEAATGFKATGLGGTNYIQDYKGNETTGKLNSGVALSNMSALTGVNFEGALRVVIRYDEFEGVTTPNTVRLGESYTLPECPHAAPTDKLFDYYTIGDEVRYPGDVITGSGLVNVQTHWKWRPFEITFANDDGAILDSRTWQYGATPSYAGTPTKDATAQYSYTFTGWTDGTNTFGINDVLPAIAADAVYTATYESSVNSYTVTWLDGNGDVLDTNVLLYGATPSYGGDATPTKRATQQYTYSFNGSWSPAIETVTGDVAYTAQFNHTVNRYPITFFDEDGLTRLLAPVSYDYGTPGSDITRPADPTKAEDYDYVYAFIGWENRADEFFAKDEPLPDVTDWDEYFATYQATPKYDVTFTDDTGGTELYTVRVPAGTVPVYEGDEPTKAEDYSFAYYFRGWALDSTV